MYNALKIIHILSAIIFVTSMTYCLYLWRFKTYQRTVAIIFQCIQAQTFRFIIPFILLQLFTGFTLFSLQPEKFTPGWPVGIFIHFVIVIAAWVVFIYFLCRSQQSARFNFYRRIQGIMLLICLSALLTLIFQMASVE